MFDAPPHDQDSVASASMNWRVYVIVPLLFIAAVALSALRKDVTQRFDEVAHASYIAHLQRTGETLAIPVTAAACAFAGILVAGRRGCLYWTPSNGRPSAPCCLVSSLPASWSFAL
jgi:hypothetical protein